MQSDRPFSVTTPLGDDVLLFFRMTAAEALGRLFDYNVELLSDDHGIKLESLLGQGMTVHAELPDGSQRHFHGIVSQLAAVGSVGRYAHYEVKLQPWLWFLSRTADCRIFQGMTVPDIIKTVFRDFGFSDFEDTLSGQYAAWDYCVQYRETAFNFVSRLMEQEGIYYYFKHESARHVLVLADGYSSHGAVAGYETVPFFPDESSDKADLDRFLDWRMSQKVQATAYALDDFDFESPRSDIGVTATAQKKHSGADFKIYDYPGEYVATGVGNEYVKYRMEELMAAYETFHASGTTRGLVAGCLFKLTDHPRQDQNQEYLVVGAHHVLEAGAYESGGGQGGETSYSGTFDAINAQVPYRSPRATAKPMIAGPQTAVVVGPSGEEIWTDKYGRVKVQFHWDRYGKNDESSSCWVRVAHAWAGKNWGMVHIPRMGQEVVIEFLEGDPDRPLITGEVYNGDQMPPYGLPDNKTQSGIKSRSSKGGGTDDFNEIRMEDQKGSEELSIHAQKDETIVVENDKTESVGHDESVSIGNDRTETVARNESLSVGGDRSRVVSKTETVSVALARFHNVGANEAVSIGGAQEVTVGAARSLTVGSHQRTTIGSSHNENVGNDHAENVGKDHTQSIGKNQTIEVGEARTITVAEDNVLTVGKNAVIEAEDSITFRTGDATIALKKDGTIVIEGKDITIKGSGAIAIKASKDVAIKGSKVIQN